MSANASGGLWALVWPAVAAVVTAGATALAGLEPAVVGALVAAVTALVSAVLTHIRAIRLQGLQGQAATALETHKGDIQKLLQDRQREHEAELEQLRSEVGLEAERAKRFEEKRRAICEALFSASHDVEAATRNTLSLLAQVRSSASPEFAQTMAKDLGAAKKQAEVASNRLEGLLKSGDGLYLDSAVNEAWVGLFCAATFSGWAGDTSALDSGLRAFRETLRKQVQLEMDAPREDSPAGTDQTR